MICIPVLVMNEVSSLSPSQSQEPGSGMYEGAGPEGEATD